MGLLRKLEAESPVNPDVRVGSGRRVHDRPMSRAMHPIRRRTTPLVLGPLICGGVASACVSLAGANDTMRGRAETRLERAGFELVGEPRRKGDFLIVTATRESVSWRLVVDGRSGEIVGQKPLGPAD